jgi:enamine deaminase RidA (YjgF/YER057c/UK114 family)
LQPSAFSAKEIDGFFPGETSMATEIEARLKALGVELPPVPVPAANYVPFVLSGKQVFVSGQIPVTPEGVKYVGKVGHEITVEDAQQAAKICAINILAILKSAAGDLDRIARIVKLVGFVNAAPDFNEPQKIVNGASDFLVAVLGDKGRHARSAVGVATLPFGVAVEVEAVAELA